MNDKKRNKFYEAWWFLHEHKMFQDDKGMDYFQRCLDVFVTKVNPKTKKIDDIKSKNTHVEVWLECGPFVYDEDFFKRWEASHDIRLDCGGDTYEDGIIKLAKLIKKYYNDDGSGKNGGKNE